MRISISGPTNSGKTTLIKEFLNRWPMYSHPSKTYRDIILESKLEHSTNTTELTQLSILNWMIEEQIKYPKGSKVIYDRCPLDNLIYTLFGNSRGQISDDIAGTVIPIVRESMKDLDIIFLLRYNPHIKVVDDGMRDTDMNFILETDKMFGDLFEQYMENLDDDVFFPKEDCPAIIELDQNFLSINDRIGFISEFIDCNGNLIESDGSVLDPENLRMYEQMMIDQKTQQESDERLNKIIKELKK